MGWGIVAGAAISYLASGDEPREQKMSGPEKMVLDSSVSGYKNAVSRQQGLINPLLDSTKKDVTPLLTSQARAASANFVDDNISKAKTPFDVAKVYSKANNNLTSATNTATNLARGNKFARGINVASMGKGFGASSTNSLLSLTDIANQRSRIDQNESINDMERQGSAVRQLAAYVGDRYSGAFAGD